MVKEMAKSDEKDEEGWWERKEEKRKEKRREEGIYSLAGKDRLGRRDHRQEGPAPGSYTRVSQTGRHVSLSTSSKRDSCPSIPALCFSRNHNVCGTAGSRALLLRYSLNCKLTTIGYLHKQNMYRVSHAYEQFLRLRLSRFWAPGS